MKAEIEYTDAREIFGGREDRTEEINTLRDLIDLYHRESLNPNVIELIFSEYKNVLHIEVYNGCR